MSVVAHIIQEAAHRLLAETGESGIERVVLQNEVFDRLVSDLGALCGLHAVFGQTHVKIFLCDGYAVIERAEPYSYECGQSIEDLHNAP